MRRDTKRNLDDLEPTIVESNEDDDLQPTMFESQDYEDVDKTRFIKKGVPSFAWLVCTDRKMNGERFDVIEGLTSIGRGSENDIVLGDDSVSKEHTKIKYIPEKDEYKAYDLVSTNGTFVNGEKVEGPVILNDNDVLVCGEIGFIFKRVQLKKDK